MINDDTEFIRQFLARPKNYVEKNSTDCVLFTEQIKCYC